MNRTMTRQENEALQYAREHISDLIIGMEQIEATENAVYFNPVFVDSPTFGIGPPFLIIKDSEGFRSSNADEEDIVIELLRKHY